jgi:hypothetical protein
MSPADDHALLVAFCEATGALHHCGHEEREARIRAFLAALPPPRADALLVEFCEFFGYAGSPLIPLIVSKRDEIIRAFLTARAARPPQATRDDEELRLASAAYQDLHGSAVAAPTPQVNAPSMGALIGYTVCSICGHDSRQDAPCRHVPPPEQRVNVIQDVTVALVPGGPPVRLRTGIHPSEISPRGPRESSPAATLDLREAIADLVEDACVAYVKDQYAGTGIFGEQAADCIREFLRTVGIELTPWVKEE